MHLSAKAAGLAPGFPTRPNRGKSSLRCASPQLIIFCHTAVELAERGSIIMLMHPAHLHVSHTPALMSASSHMHDLLPPLPEATAAASSELCTSCSVHPATAELCGAQISSSDPEFSVSDESLKGGESPASPLSSWYQLPGLIGCRPLLVPSEVLGAKLWRRAVLVRPWPESHRQVLLVYSPGGRRPWPP